MKMQSPISNKLGLEPQQATPSSTIKPLVNVQAKYLVGTAGEICPAIMLFLNTPDGIIENIG
jgi:hypothetical protein